MTQRTILLAVPALIAVVLIGAYALVPKAPVEAPVQETEPTEQTESATENSEPAPIADPIFASAPIETSTTLRTAEASQTATLIVEGTSFPVRTPEGSTVEEAMASLRTEGVLSYETRSYTGLGSFITSIQGKSDTSEYYWILHVNGKKSATGISATRISSGDVIEWKYEHKY